LAFAASVYVDEAAAATERWFRPKVIDQVFNSNAVTAILRRNARTLDGGRTIDFPSLYAKGTTEWIGKTDTYSAPFVDQLGAARLDWKINTTPVVLFTADLLMNSSSKHQRINLVMQKNMAAARTMGDEFGNALFTLDYTTTDQIDSLDHAVSDQTGTSDETGFSATYAGVSRTTQSVWRSNIDDTAATLSIGVLNDSWLTASEGSDQPNLIVSNNKAYGLYYDLLTPIQRQGTDDLLGKAGFTSTLFNGKPWVIDSHVASSDRSVGGVSTEYVYMLNTNYIEIVAHRDVFFAFMGVKQPIDQWSVIGRYFFMGNVPCYAPRFQAKLTALTG